MHNFGEIRTCIVLLFTAVLIVKTRARFIYHPDPMVQCHEAKVPCSGHRSEDSCKEYCRATGFADGKCNAGCCLCLSAGRMRGAFTPMDQRMRPPFLPQRILTPPAPGPPPQSFMEIHTENFDPDYDFSMKLKQDKMGIPSGPNSLPGQKKKPSPSPSRPSNDANTDICVTPGCVKAAYSLLMNIDEEVDPCQDFYQFACGNFEKTAMIPDDKAELTVIGSLTDKLHLQIRKAIEEIRPENEKTSSRLARKLFSSCMNQEIMEAKGAAPLQSVLKELGGWPVVEGAKWTPSSTFKWTDLIAKLRHMGISGGYLIGIAVGPDVKVPGKRIIVVGEPQLSFGREELQNPGFVPAYKRFQTEIAMLLGADPKSAEAEMDAVFQFETKLANISLPREMTRAHPLKFYNPISISNLQNIVSPVDWLDFIRGSLPDSLEIKEDEIVTVAVPPHLVNLLRLIEMTDQRTLVNYLMWRAASSLVPYLGGPASAMKVHFSARVTGQLQKPPKPQECVSLVTTSLGHAVGKIYVEKYFDENSRTEAVKMFQVIHKMFDNVLDEAEWMDPATKDKAYQKAKAMRSFTGYPQQLLDEKNLEELYNGLELSSDNFFGNVLNISRNAARYTLGKLREPIDPTDWKAQGKPAVVNAFYNPMHNLIQFPAGILQGHFFSSDRPHYMNFGSVGWVYGHELIHGFDDQGSRFDLKGDLKDWWHPATKQRYHEKTQCIVRQYSQYKFSDLVTNQTTQLNGALSQGENIADNEGIKLAYRGYQQWLQSNTPEQRLPGMEKYNPNQVFWITAANNWCSKHRPMAQHHKMKSGVHPPGKFRVLGSFTNSNEFARDFNCPAGSPMNPVDKCVIW